MTSRFVLARLFSALRAPFLALFCVGAAFCLPTQAQTGAGDLGGNLGVVNYYTPSMPFSDLMRTRSSFAKFPFQDSAGNWAYVSPTNWQSGGAWPAEDFGTKLFTLGSTLAAGPYVVTYTGGTSQTQVVPSLATSASGGAVTHTSNTVTLADGRKQVTINFAAPIKVLYMGFRNTGGTVRNVSVIQPGGSAGSLFRPAYLNYVSRISTLRFVDWTNTNGNPQVEWSDRPSPASQVQNVEFGGVAWEYCIALANAADKDMWINIPHRASDDYVTKLAQLLRYGSNASGTPYTATQTNPVHPPLESERKIYIEYSNELWNSGIYFPQGQWIRERARAEVTNPSDPMYNPSDLNYDNLSTADSDGDGWPDNTKVWANRRIGRKMQTYSTLFRNVFGASGFKTRYFPVIVGQISGEDTSRDSIEYIAKKFPTNQPKDFIWGYGGGAPYYSLWASRDTVGTSAQGVLNGLATHLVTLPTSEFNYERLIGTATYYGLKPVCYEGGADVALTANNLAAKRDALLSHTIQTSSNHANLPNATIRDLEKRLVNDWFRAGGGLFCYYTFTATSYDGQYKFWGTTNDLTNNAQSPRTLALEDLSNANKPAITNGYAVPGQFAGTAGGTWPARYRQYLLRVSPSGNYNMIVNARANIAGQKLEVFLNNVSKGFVNIPQNANFVDAVAFPISLGSGLQTVRLRSENSFANVSINLVKFNAASANLTTNSAPSASTSNTPVVSGQQF